MEQKPQIDSNQRIPVTLACVNCTGISNVFPGTLLSAFEYQILPAVVPAFLFTALKFSTRKANCYLPGAVEKYSRFFINYPNTPSANLLCCLLQKNIYPIFKTT